MKKLKILASETLEDHVRYFVEEIPSGNYDCSPERQKTQKYSTKALPGIDYRCQGLLQSLRETKKQAESPGLLVHL